MSALSLKSRFESRLSLSQRFPIYLRNRRTRCMFLACSSHRKTGTATGQKHGHTSMHGAGIELVHPVFQRPLIGRSTSLKLALWVRIPFGARYWNTWSSNRNDWQTAHSELYPSNEMHANTLFISLFILTTLCQLHRSYTSNEKWQDDYDWL